MRSPIHYLRMLAEVKERFTDPDWSGIESWLQDEARKTRVRDGGFVPESIEALVDGEEPTLHPGDIVLTPILSRAEQFTLPAGCELGAGLHATGTVEIEEGAQIAGDVIAGERILWRGGRGSVARNLVAPEIHLARAGLFDGGIWCDRLIADESAPHVAPGTVTRGVIVVDEPGEAPLIVGGEARLGGLRVKGAVRCESAAAVSHIQASGAVEIGRQCEIGSVEAPSVTVDSRARVALIRAESLRVARQATIDTIRCQGDIVMEAEVRVTGHAILSEEGRLIVPEGEGWHTQREHWFYLLPDEALVPYSEESERPEGSHLIVLRTLTHALWQQAQQLSGRSL